MSGKKKDRTQAQLRAAIVAIAQKMSCEGLSPGKSGNVSARWRSGMLITPTGMAYDALKPVDIAFVDKDGRFDKKGRAPSSEWHFHLGIYQAREEAGAILHCHSRFATVLACAKKEIPAFHYMVAAAGGAKIPLAPYALFGTDELSKHAVKALKGVHACLLANHGQIAFGKTLENAYDLALEVEELAAQYVELLKLDAVNLLSAKEMRAVIEKFKTYGQQPGEEL